MNEEQHPELQHNWHSMSLTKVHVLADDKGKPLIIPDPLEDADPEVVICRACGENLDSAFGLICVGDSDDT